MGNILGFVGQIAGAAIQAGAQRKAIQMQLDALDKQRNFVFNQLDPNTLGPMATQADITRAKSQLALQGQIDPALLQTRYASETQMLSQLQQALSPSADAAKVAGAAAQTALAGTPGINEAKNKLVDAALADLKGGATLPPDLEAELVQHGLEKTGMVTGRASAQGVGGTMLRTILGEAGIKLQAQREQQAAALAGSAQQLEQARTGVLASLFPSLAQRQASNLQLATGAFGASSAAVPQAGLGGTNLANIWMARVGATNQLTQDAANAAAQGAMAQGQIWGNAIGGAARAAGGVNWKNLFGGTQSTPGVNLGGSSGSTPYQSGDYAAADAAGMGGGEEDLPTGD